MCVVLLKTDNSVSQGHDHMGVSSEFTFCVIRGGRSRPSASWGASPPRPSAGRQAWGEAWGEAPLDKCSQIQISLKRRLPQPRGHASLRAHTVIFTPCNITTRRQISLEMSNVLLKAILQILSSHQSRWSGGMSLCLPPGAA